MGHVDVVDRGSREIVVFLSGAIDETTREALADAAERVRLLLDVNDVSRVVIDSHQVTDFGAPGVRFLRGLEVAGREHGFDVALAMTSPAVAHALHP
ncbi:MAG TPA: STAS domain-containing protein [Actinopolymorphaceae bacterium]